MRLKFPTGLVLSFYALLHLTGCQLTQQSAMQTELRHVSQEMVTPIIAAALEDAQVRSGMFQGQLSGINPVMRFDVDVFVGTTYKTVIKAGVEGVSLNLAGAAQADQGPDLADESSSPPE